MVFNARKAINLKTDSSKLHVPKKMQLLFERIKLEHYEELYEEDANGTVSLADTLEEVLKLMSDHNKTLTHLRYLWMTLILILVVEPTLNYYQSQNRSYENIINLLTNRIVEIIKISPYNNHAIIDFHTAELQRSILNNNCYTEREIANFQILDEALNVFYNAIQVINYDQSLAAILNILEDCLEGYAIFPGSHGRRELFDWWLLDVVPASYNLSPPQRFYVVEGVKNKEEIRIRQNLLLKTVSDKIRHLIIKVALNKRHNNIFPDLNQINRLSFPNSGKIYQSKIPQLTNDR